MRSRGLCSLLLALWVPGVAALGCSGGADDVFPDPHDPPPDGDYEPCAGKVCGETCTVCDPRDEDCVETAVVKYCQDDGSCSPERPQCEPTNPCATVLCPPDTQCVVLESYPPQAKCVPIPPPDPEPCEPTNPCAAVLCPVGTICEVIEGEPPRAACVPPPDDPCARVRCAEGSSCFDGICVPDEPVFCGGIIGEPCPGAGTCIDDPRDDCDPDRGGADCGGLCVCQAIALCIEGYVWDGSPGVCSCVRAPDTSTPCGANECGPGTYCCNASCGICAPEGGACIQIACE